PATMRTNQAIAHLHCWKGPSPSNYLEAAGSSPRINDVRPARARSRASRGVPFCDSLDHVGPFTRSLYNPALAYDAIQGPDTRDHACAERELELVGAALAKEVDKLHIAMTDGFFARNGAAHPK
ncbi:MAG: amidase family protein, partial [Pseudomonadota bacterium]|nr:amidase family protein [Pseudomonadota bacterium]